MSSTYGSWLPGDKRGFRTRGHREHVEGDYKQPPAEDYTLRHEAARGRMKAEAVVLSVEAREAVCEAVRYALVEVHGLEMLGIAVGATHLHLLGRFPVAQKPTPLRRGLRETDPVRFFVGIAKERSAKVLAKAGLAEPGRVWAKRGKIVRVRDRSHQLNVLTYILKHEREGAAVWSFKQKPTP